MQREHIKQFIPVPTIISAIACMMLMCQAYLMAPLILPLEKEFSSSLINLAIPAFAIPFAIAAAAMVLLGPEINLRRCFLFSLAALCAGNYLLSTVGSVSLFLCTRALTGFSTGFMMPSALLLAINSYEKKRSLKHMVLVIFALAAGMTFGPSLGGWLNGSIGWRNLYRLISIVAALLFIFYLLNEKHKGRERAVPGIKLTARSGWQFKSIYRYSFVYLTGVFHSGVFVWISYYFTTQYGLSEFDIATDLFIFGLPGFIITLLMYYFRLDKKVIGILYVALGITVAGLLIFLWNLPLWLAECLLGIMSVGFGCSQPLFIGILKLPRTGLSLLRPVAKGSGLLFAGYGSGPLIMTALLTLNLSAAMLFLVVLVLALAYIALRVW
jgi:predicted MFS family arabinose efflux permease